MEGEIAVVGEPLRIAGLVGDVHADDARLERALRDLAQRRVERILCTGDIVDGPGDVDRCVALLCEHGVVTVRGNHDRWLLAEVMRDLPAAQRARDLAPATLELLRRLPATVELDTAGGRLLLCHGLGADDMNHLGPDDSGYALEVNEVLQRLIAERRFRFVVNGHSHRRYQRRFGELLIVNAGALSVATESEALIVDFGAAAVAT